MESIQWVHVVYMAGAIMLLAPGVIALNRDKRTRWRNVLVWVALFGALVLGYQLWQGATDEPLAGPASEEAGDPGMGRVAY